ncbi:hypothetical protein [Saccharomonospora xinjiangensis]|uniref:SUKH-4 immunity protein n=1 Tax=Saccharomonospora xinjiangensis XJ-54 TaxID=882086 RepID=I0UWR8_9PSEU|nr:hypothetical protein [Saccharomonospora xinjiangensis]EID52321.1 hypothetical protein SacxiDRAFT_0032 [Saccharomonospora xinjiangensis XJ-54]
MSGSYSPVPELNALKDFQDSLGGRSFAPGFELFTYNDELDWFCGEAPDAYLDRLVPFAYATSSGSYYALWRCDDRTDLATLPVIFFGDEGDLRVKANDVRELLRLLAVEPDDPDDRARLACERQRYRVWLRQNLGLTPLGDVSDASDVSNASDASDVSDVSGVSGVSDKALAEHTRRFAAWVSEFASDALLEHVLAALDLDASSR